MSRHLLSEQEGLEGTALSVVVEMAYRRYCRFWITLARTVHISEAEAEDIVHTVLAAVLQSGAKHFETLEHVRNYVARGVLNRAIQYRQRMERRAPWDEKVEIMFPVESDVMKADRELFSRILRGALRRLPRRDFEILKLRFYCGFRFVEISAILGLPISTLKSREDAAVRRLRSLLRKKVI
jgi:RNA polymerase sigma factor (sigma-70 family)